MLTILGHKTFDKVKLLESLKRTFLVRGLDTLSYLSFTKFDLELLQSTWNSYIKKFKISDAPKNIEIIIEEINLCLREEVGL